MQVDFEKMLVTLNGNFEHESFADKQYRFRFFTLTQDGRVKNSDYSFTIITTFAKKAQKYDVNIPWETSKSPDNHTETDNLNETDSLNQTDSQN